MRTRIATELRRRSIPGDSRRLLALVVGIITPVILILAMGVVSCGRGGDPSLVKAKEAWDSGDYELAAEEYERFLQQNPNGSDSIDARLNLANIYFLNLRRYDRARNLYRDFLAAAPSHPEAPAARQKLAEVLSEVGRSYEAIAEYENLNPADHNEWRRIRLRIADLYYDQKNYSQALAEYEKVTDQVAYDDLSEQAYLRQTSIYHLARTQYQQALPIYEKIAANTNDAKVRRRSLLGLADCHAGLYQFDQAIRYLNEVNDPAEQEYVTRRIAELEQRKRDASKAPQMNFVPKTRVPDAEQQPAQPPPADPAKKDSR